jgi:mannose-6-phosphate isomerase-like protein (cupin superfamily)
MPEAIDIKATLATLNRLGGRTPDTPMDVFESVFAELASTETGGVYAGSFDGESAWERHPAGDELVQVIDGATRLIILDGQGGEQVLDMTAGMVTVVPRGHWHKFISETGVSVMTMTPAPTDHSTAARPDRT